MQIIISDKSSAPIYEQITKQIKEGILNHAPVSYTHLTLPTKLEV